MNSRTHIKTQKSAIFVRKNLKINIWMIKNIVKLSRKYHCHYTGEYRDSCA